MNRQPLSSERHRLGGPFASDGAAVINVNDCFTAGAMNLKLIFRITIRRHSGSIYLRTTDSIVAVFGRTTKKFFVLNNSFRLNEVLCTLVRVLNEILNTGSHILLDVSDRNSSYGSKLCSQ